MSVNANYTVGLNFGPDPKTFPAQNKTKVTKGDLGSYSSLVSGFTVAMSDVAVHFLFGK